MASKQVGMNWLGGQDEIISPISQLKRLSSSFFASHGPLGQSGAGVCECLSNSVSANAPRDALPDLSSDGLSNGKGNQKGYEGPWETFLWDFLQSWGNSKSYSDKGGRRGELPGLSLQWTGGVSLPQAKGCPLLSSDDKESWITFSQLLLAINRWLISTRKLKSIAGISLMTKASRDRGVQARRLSCILHSPSLQGRKPRSTGSPCFLAKKFKS